MVFDKWTLLYSDLLLLICGIGNIAAQSCGGNYTKEYGVFMSPNYPNVYTLNVECIYRITPSTMSSITINFETFELDRSTGDYVLITCESDTGYVPKNFSWNNDIAPISMPSCSIAQLYFHSDSSHKYSTKGFRVQYQVNTEDCGNTVFTNSSATISSPNYPQNYSNYENCTYSIWAPETSSFTLTFEAFKLESENCQFDWVQIRCDNSSYILPKYCGSTLPKPAYISNCNKVLIWFHTDRSVVYSGFSLQYSFTSYGCGKSNYAGLSGVVTSPNYPEGCSSKDCTYNLYPVSSVALSFQSFDLEPIIDKSFGDYVRFHCYSNESGSRSYYGNTLPPLISYQLCSHVHIHFLPNSALSGTGFSMKYQVNPLVSYSAITYKPKNWVLHVGSSLTLYCTSNAVGYYPSWTLSRDGTDENTTVIASFCDINSGFTSKYSATKGATGVCDLLIKSATLAQAGVYTCIDVGLASFSSLVTVVDVDYTVTKQSQVVKEDLLTFKFSIQFNGSVAPAPILPMMYYWNITGNSVSISNITLPNILISSINVTAEPEVVPSYGFKLTFSAPANRIGYATNAPTYSYTYSSPSYTVQYWPEESNMAITGHNDGYIAYNGVLQCNVSSNPLSSYRWLDQTNGIYTNGDTFVVTHSGTYTCNASNVIRSKTYWSSKSITVDFLNTTSTFSDQGQDDLNDTVIVLAVFLAICALGNIGVAIFCIIRRCRETSSEEDHQHTIQGIQERPVKDSVKPQATGSVYEDLPIRVLSPESSRKTDTNGEVFYEHLNHGFDNPTVYENLQRQ